MFRSQQLIILMCVTLTVAMAWMVTQHLSADQPQQQVGVATSLVRLDRTTITSIERRLNCAVNSRTSTFKLGQISTGNSLEGYQAVQLCWAESDFHLTQDQHLIAAHDATMGGSCGQVDQATLALIHACVLANGQSVASLDDFLTLPLSEWYLDLKSTDTDNEELALATVRYAMSTIRRYSRQAGAVMMVYRPTPKLVEELNQSGLRVGLKGYPEDSDQAQSLITQAITDRFEMTCFKLSVLNPSLLSMSSQAGLWHLSWDDEVVPVEDWSTRVDWGMNGMIVTRVGLAQQVLASKL